MSSLYFAVNDRRLDRSERGVTTPFSREPVSRSAAVRVMGIKPVLALCGREKELPEVSHVSLTERADAQGGRKWAQTPDQQNLTAGSLMALRSGHQKCQ